MAELRLRKRSFFGRHNIEFLLLILPALAVTIVYRYLPMGGLVIAFKDYRPGIGIAASDWVGFQNFEFFFASDQVWNVTRNTLLYNLAFIVTGTVTAITFAILLYEVSSRSAVKTYQTLFLLPYFLSWVVVGIIMYGFLNARLGIANPIIERFGGTAVEWYADPRPWPGLLLFTNVWKWSGYNMIIYYAALMGIDPTLFEAAEIDGAGWFRKVFAITIPMLMPVAVVMLILSLGRIFFADFGMFFQLTQQSPLLLESTDVINWFTYRALIELRDYGMSSAIGLYQSVIGFILIIVTNWAARRMSGNESQLF